MKIKLFILTTILWANVALSENNQFVNFFNTVRSLTADFSQATYNAEFELTSSASGNLIFQRPQQLRWHITNPSEQILLLNNKELWQVDTDLEQAILQKTKDLSKTPLYWLINKPENIESTPKFSHTADGIDWYLATNPNSRPIEFGFVNGLLYAMTLNDDLGGLISITFENLLINPKLNSKAFKLAIGPDFDIIK